MSMNVGPSEGGEDETISTINTTPLVDVMLVLLIIFLITIPVIVPVVKVQMPTPKNIPTQTKPEDIPISVSADGKIYWKNGLVNDRSKLLELVVTEARKVEFQTTA